MSVPFYGDYDTTETVYIPFNTFSSDDPSASVTITNLAAADVEIHKDGSTTQRSSDNGVTVSIDFDSVTGNHLVAIDLSDNSDAGYYANGSRYQVRMEGTTVDGATINAWIGSFSIGCMLRPTTAGATLDVESGGCAGIDWGNVANKTTANDLSATDIQLCDTVTTLTGHTAQTGDTYAALPSNFSDLSITVTTGRVDVASIEGGDATDAINAECDTALSDYDPPTKTEMDTAFAGLNDLSAADVNAECDTALSDYDPPTKTEMDTAFAGLNDVSSADVTTACTSSLNTYDPPTKTEMDTAFAGLNDLSAADVNAECDTALSDYDPPTKTEMDTAFAGLNDLSAADVNAECDTALSDYDPPTKAELDSGLAGLNDISTSDVNTEVLDVLNTDTFAEPGQENPAATTTLVKKIGYLYKFLRNKIDNDGSTIQVYADDASTVDQKSSVSESGGTVTRGEFGTGP